MASVHQSRPFERGGRSRLPAACAMQGRGHFRSERLPLGCQSDAAHGVSTGLSRARPMQARVTVSVVGEGLAGPVDPTAGPDAFSSSGRQVLATLPRLTFANRFRGTCQRKSPASFPAGLSSRLRHSRSSIVASGLSIPMLGSPAGKLFDPAHVPVVACLPVGFVAPPRARGRLAGAI